MESQGITQTFNQSLMQSSISSAVQKANTLTSQGLMEKPRVTINLMDVSFLEQNLSQILEVSQLSLNMCIGFIKQLECCNFVRRLVGLD